MGRGSYLRGWKFESNCQIKYGSFFTFIHCKIVLMLEETKNQRKRGQGLPIEKRLVDHSEIVSVWRNLGIRYFDLPLVRVPIFLRWKSALWITPPRSNVIFIEKYFLQICLYSAKWRNGIFEEYFSARLEKIIILH